MPRVPGARRLRRSQPTPTRPVPTQDLVDQVPFWWHSIDVGDGVITPGHKSPQLLAHELATLDLPDLVGRSVLDIGAWDGYFSFAAERAGASRVVALDHFVWSLDLVAQQEYWRSCRESGVVPEMYETVPGLWHPTSLPGKRGFDTAHQLLGSRVEPVVADFVTADLSNLGSFDVVLYLGVSYHLQDPLGGLRRVRSMTRQVAVVETEAVALPGLEDVALWEFFGQAELNADISNWWAPNMAALHSVCRAAGFASVVTKAGPPPAAEVTELTRYRAIVHAYC